jgi:hypothetical protein
MHTATESRKSQVASRKSQVASRKSQVASRKLTARPCENSNYSAGRGLQSRLRFSLPFSR